MAEYMEPSAAGRNPDRQAVIINRIDAAEICFEAKSRFNREQIYRLNFSPVGGTPFSAQTRVLDVSESNRKGFYFVAAKFEHLTPNQHQSLLSLMASINLAKIQNHTSE